MHHSSRVAIGKNYPNLLTRSLIKVSLVVYRHRNVVQSSAFSTRWSYGGVADRSRMGIHGLKDFRQFECRMRS